MRYMKKFFLMVVAVLMAASSVNAQDDGYEKKHEVGVFYGIESASNILSVYSGMFAAAAGDQSSWWGPVGVEYYYHLSPVVGMGAVAEYAGCKAIDDRSGTRDLNESFITLMPSVKFNWLRKKHFGMYSSLSAGVMLLSVSFDDSLKQADPDAKDETLAAFMFHATALGAEFGAPTFRGFVELGFGEKGVLCGGLRYKF